MLILYDWLTYTSKIDSPQSVIELLGLEDVEFLHLDRGLYGYRDSLMFSGVRICFNNPSYPGVMVDISGSGCRALEEFGHCDWSVIFHMILSDEDNYHITRLDVAADEKEGLLDVRFMTEQARELNYVSQFQNPCVIEQLRNGGITLYFGSRQSEIFFRIYDKSKERESKVGADSAELGHWTRFEISMRHDRALKFLTLPFDKMGLNFCGVVNNYLRYVKPSGDTNKSRCETAGWWLRFVTGLDKISLYTPCDTEYSLDRAKDYVYGQAGNAVDTLIAILGMDKFLQELEHHKPKKVAMKYRTLIAHHDAEMQEIIGDLSEYEAPDDVPKIVDSSLPPDLQPQPWADIGSPADY